MSNIKGGCLCGAVNLFTTSTNNQVGACHCNMCRRWGGGPFLGIELGSDVSFSGEENIGVYNSSEWAERAFCNKCGTHLFYRLKPTNQYFVPVGLFHNCEGFIFDHQIFIEEKPGYYCFADKTNNLTGAEVLAQFAPILEK